MKYMYSLFGDEKLGHKRFLYDGYLRADHPDQGVRFELTAEKLKHLNEKAEKLAFQIEDTLKGIIHSRVWPVDRRLIMYTVYCFLNARERVRSLLEIHRPEELRFFAAYSPSVPTPAQTVTSYISQLTPEMYEGIIILLLKAMGVEIHHEAAPRIPFRNVQREAGSLLLVSSLKGRLFPLVSKYRFFKELLSFRRKNRRNNTKPSLLLLNGYLAPKDVGTCREFANVLHLDGWWRASEPFLNKKMANPFQLSDGTIDRKQWEKALRGIPRDDEDDVLEGSIPLIVTSYPVSLMEGRNRLRGKARKLMREVGCHRTDEMRVALCIDHRLWKHETLSALSEEIIENGGFVVESSHDNVTGLLNYGLMLILDQCLASHYLVNFKKPFIRLQKKSPKVIQVDSLRRFGRMAGGKDRMAAPLSIWYFPHYLVTEPKFHSWSYGMENPETFLGLQKTAMTALNRIARHPEVKEIVIKLKSASGRTKEEKKFMDLIEQLLENRRSSKIRFVTNLTMQQAVRYVSIAVHDFFSGGFVETVYAGVPTIAILPREADIPHRLPDREDWIQSGLFVRNADALYERLLGLVEGKSPPNYEKMKESFLITCGLGSPTPGEALRSILTELN